LTAPSIATPCITFPDTSLALQVENPAGSCYRERVAVYPLQKERPELRRRSQRVRMRVSVVVRPQTVEKNARAEKTETLVVNAHGALLLLATPVAINEFVIVQNVKTGEELLCRVTLVGPSLMGKTQVAVEFIKPAPDFWGVDPPPKSWKAGKPLPSLP
jgi:hypothetical protein